MKEHLLLYDGECGLCDAAVEFVWKRDRKRTFCFAPLQGLTAAPFLQLGVLDGAMQDSVILVEGFRSPHPRIYLRSQAVWRVCWHLGGFWTIPGCLKFLPGWLFDWGYNIVARMRHRLFGPATCRLPPRDGEGDGEGEGDRDDGQFLP